MTNLLDAFNMAAQAHAGQFRKYPVNGKQVPYIVHPVRVMLRCQKFLGDHIAEACLLHDVIEDCGVTYGEIKDKINQWTADIVLQVSNPSHLPEHKHKKRAERKAIDREHLRNAWPVAKGLKMIDRLDNLEDMQGNAPKDFLTLYVSETKLLLDVLGSGGMETQYYYYRSLFSQLTNKVHELEDYLEHSKSGPVSPPNQLVN